MFILIILSLFFFGCSTSYLSDANEWISELQSGTHWNLHPWRDTLTVKTTALITTKRLFEQNIDKDGMQIDMWYSGARQKIWFRDNNAFPIADTIRATITFARSFQKSNELQGSDTKFFANSFVGQLRIVHEMEDPFRSYTRKEQDSFELLFLHWFHQDPGSPFYTEDMPKTKIQEIITNLDNKMVQNGSAYMMIDKEEKKFLDIDWRIVRSTNGTVFTFDLEVKKMVIMKGKEQVI